LASITIRNLDPQTKARLRIRAAHHSRSIEEEARDILRRALSEPQREQAELAATIRKRFEPFGGVALSIPPRQPMREPPDLGS
jgi:plasmid stability protein